MNRKMLPKLGNENCIDELQFSSATETCRSSICSFERERKSLSVSFQNITIREYTVTIGDNPACSGGPPISLDWDYMNEVTVPFEEYEEGRPTRRSRAEMQMPSETRRELLHEMDISFSRMIQASIDVSKVRDQRARTAARVYRRMRMKKNLLGVLTLPVLTCIEKRKRHRKKEQEEPAFVPTDIHDSGRSHVNMVAHMPSDSSSSSQASVDSISDSSMDDLAFTHHPIRLNLGSELSPELMPAY